VIRTTPNCAI